MNDKSKNNTTTNQATEALDDYLELLLSPEQSDVESFEINEKQIKSKLYHIDSHPARKQNKHLKNVERLIDDLNERLPELKTNPVKKVLVEPVLDNTEQLLQPTIILPEQDLNERSEVEEVADELVTETLTEQVSPKVWIPEDQEFVREDWTEEPFQTLLFDVAGLTLAVPLIKLGGIHRIEEDITPLFGKPDWFMGLTPSHEGNINVIDTTRWVMPEKYEQAKENGLDYQFIILLGDSKWGLACNGVQNAIALSPDNIRWRAKAGKRPWLAGVLIKEMSALLDVDTLIYLLEENFPR